jgi:hypothetical protein
MSTREDLSREVAAAVAGVSHDATFKDDDGRSTLKQEDAIYQYLPKHGIMVMLNHDNTDVEIWYDPATTDGDWFRENFAPLVKKIARRYLYGTTIRSYAGDITPKQLSHRTEVKEARNSANISYHPLGDTKIRLAHSKSVTEEKPGARSRNIKALFIEDNAGEKILEISRRRKDIMELLRGTKKFGGKEQVDEVRERGRNEVVMLRRMMERAARTGDLTDIKEYALPNTDTADNSLVSESIKELDDALNKLLG